MTEWKDATSYSQGQRGKISPTSWEIEISGVRVWISRGHRYFPEEWVMNCFPLDIREKIICSVDKDNPDGNLAEVRKAALLAIYHAAKKQIATATALADTAFSAAKP